MSKYVSASPKQATYWGWDYNAAECLAKTVVEDENKPVETGLLDASGNKIYRLQDKGIFGFYELKERQ